MDNSLEDYILSHIEPEPQHLERLNRDTQLHHIYAHQCSGHLQGRVLAFLSKLVSPRLIIELGTFTGYSALCLAEGLRSDGQLHTIEHNDEDEETLRELFAADERICLHIGDASELIASLPGPWDLAFIDANKREYVRYFKLLLPKMAQNSLIIADNTLWAGKVCNPSENDAQTVGIREFNEYIRPYNPLILPLRDGMTLIRINGTPKD